MNTTPRWNSRDLSFLACREVSRRDVLRALGATALGAALGGFPMKLRAGGAEKDSLPVQFYKSLTEEQHAAIVLPLDHPKRGYVSNWWYICPEQRLNTFYSPDQQDLVKQIFESLHSAEYRDKMDWQVQKDLMGEIKNTPSVGFFGTPADADFEFIYTGHHVTRRCHALTDEGLLFNEFYSALDGKQQEKILVARQPRSEKPSEVIARRATDLPGLCGADLSKDQQAKLLETIRRMLACFRPGDVAATMKTIEDANLVERLFISCYGGAFDIGNDKVWDVWQIEGPDMVWYFRGMPHIHGYFHLAV